MNELFRFVSVRPPRTATNEPAKTEKESAREAAAAEAARRKEEYEKALAAKEALAKQLAAAAEKERKERECRLADLREAREKLAQLLAESRSEAKEQDEDVLDDFEETKPSEKERLKRNAKLKEQAEAARKSAKEIRAQLRTISGVAKEVLTKAGLELDPDLLPDAISALDDRIAVVAEEPQAPIKFDGPTRYTFYQGHMIASGGRTGSDVPGPISHQSSSNPIQVALADTVNQPRLLLPFNPPNLYNLPPATPEAVGYARILGVGDLMAVREEPKRYELGEIAHIENILAGEFKDRSHRRKQKTEETIGTFTERETEKERDLQSAERFQLTTEASEILKFDSKLEAGFNLSASYGPTVSVGANTSTSLALSSEKSKKSASAFSREVTERAKNRVIEKVREEHTRKTTEEIEEINKHGFDNKENAAHVVGIYRWVDKIQRARLLNYGTRLMLEFVIPEPAAFFMQALVTAPQGVTMSAPSPKILSLCADDIRAHPDSENDYRRLAQLYQVTNIEPPPPNWINLVENFSFDEVAATTSRTISRKVAIPAEYAVYNVAFTRSGTHGAQNWTTHVSAANKRDFFSNSTGVEYCSLNGVQGELPITVSVWDKGALSVHVSVRGTLTKAATTVWQIKTYKALLEGYQNLRSKFDEQVAVSGIRQANQIHGFAPERNRAIERDEIKRSVISMLTGQHFDQFGAITERIVTFDDPDGIGFCFRWFSEINFEQAILEGKYAQFFENAFEWSNMSYVFYPYFWGRKETWVEKIGQDNADPTHLAFLQAGAARVVVPVRPGYDPVVIHYLDTGEIWAGEDVPDLAGVSAPYVDIATEIREQQGNPIDDPLVVDEWDVRLPTSLVILQADAQLPVFIPDEPVE